MYQLLSQPFTRLLFPLLMLASSLWAVFWSSRLPTPWHPLLVEILPVASIAIAALLSLHFNRSRYSFLLLFIAIAGLSQTTWRGQILPASETLLFVLLMLNAVAFSLLRDRSLFSVHGLARIAFIALQGAMLYALARFTDLPAYLLLTHDWFALPDPLAMFVQVPDGVLLAAIAASLLHVILSVARNSSLQATFFGCQIGMLGIFSGYPHPAFVPVMLSCCGLMVALAIIVDSHDMAYRDELTGLPSRRALNQALLSLGRRYTIAMLDIDHFKKFNDTHGHDIGDEVLRMVASKIAAVRGGGKPFRYGGEEFTVVFAGKTAEQASGELEALRASIEGYQMQLRQTNRKAGKTSLSRRSKRGARDKSLSVTISIGFAEREASQKLPESVIKAADQALYRAKQQGRNCVSA